MVRSSSTVIFCNGHIFGYSGYCGILCSKVYLLVLPTSDTIPGILSGAWSHSWWWQKLDTGGFGERVGEMPDNLSASC